MGAIIEAPQGSLGNILGPGSWNDNALIRADGDNSNKVQGSSVGLSDAGAITNALSLELTGLTSSRLVGTSAGKVLQSEDLVSWVAGTANRVTVADDGDGSVTLSGPQDIATDSSPTFANVSITGAGYTQYRDAAIRVASLNDGHLDLTADVVIDLNAPVDATKPITMSGAGADGFIGYTGTHGGGGEGIGYKDGGGTSRSAFGFYATNLVRLQNRAANGVVQIAANTAAAGGGGEVIVAQFEDDLIYTNVKFGIGTTTVPHAGRGYAKLAIDGTAVNAAGPHMQFTTSNVDDFPLMQIFNWSHDTMAIWFDAYYQGGANYLSSDSGSNFGIYKITNLLQFTAETGIAPGNAITWNVAFQIEPDAELMISPGAALKTYWRDIGIGIYSQSDSNVTMFADGSITLDSPSVQVPDGSLGVGQNNAGYGLASLFGAGTGSAIGGQLRLYAAADHDGSIDYYRLYVNTDDLEFCAVTTSKLTYKGGEDRWDFAAPVVIGTSNPTLTFADSDGDDFSIDVDAGIMTIQNIDSSPGRFDFSGGHLGLGNSASTDTHIMIGSESYATTGTVIGYGCFPQYAPTSAATANTITSIQGNTWFSTINWGVGSRVQCLDFYPAPLVAGTAFGSANLAISAINTAGLLNVLGRTITADTITGIAVAPLTNIFGGTDDTTANIVRGIHIASAAATTGTWGRLCGLEIEAQTSGVINQGLWMAGDSVGADIVFGAGSDATIYYDGTDMKLVTDLVAASDFVLDCGTQKTLELAEVVWDDINFGSGQAQLPAASSPGVVTFTDNLGADTGIATAGYAVGEKLSYATEYLHDVKEGSDIYFHVHFQCDDAPTGTDYVKWQIEYTITRDGATCAPTTTITKEIAVDTQYEQLRADFDLASGTGLQTGDQIKCTLLRVASTGDAYAGEAKLVTFGVHVQKDTIGSRQILAK